MPYYEVKAADLSDAKKLQVWAATSIAAASRQPTKKKKR
jgi:TfoX/Sxy family transcriptional regulator of competence genes